MTPYIGFFGVIERLRAAAKPAPAPVIEPARIELTAEQFAAVDEQAGIAS